MSKHVNKTSLVIGAMMMAPGAEIEESQVWLSRKRQDPCWGRAANLNDSRTDSYSRPPIPVRFMFEQFPNMTREEVASKMDQLKEKALEMFDRLDGCKLELGIKEDADSEGAAPDLAGPQAPA